ncbi:hypothetical protein FVE85_3029 [Porphyridium purpureum]|uniref:RRM domain-containing protein n=1 Tax=Porphyridium purpureum TaxID=35688 RepID=A0A5J4YUC0_PORPP|nr:hypothetical protein FVE85_3029 [Porphyridium purpureum]|eukprot:POR0669..scf227_4
MESSTLLRDEASPLEAAEAIRPETVPRSEAAGESDALPTASTGAETRNVDQEEDEMDIDAVVIREETPLVITALGTQPQEIDRTSATLYVRNLPKKGVLPRTVRRALLERFERWRLPTKRSVKLGLYAHTQGSAFVICRSREAAKQAIHSIHGKALVCGKRVEVCFSNQKSELTRRRDQDDEPGSIHKAYNARKKLRIQRTRSKLASNAKPHTTQR